MATNLIEVKNSLTTKLIINFFIICAVAGIVLAALSYVRSKQYVWKIFSSITTSCAVSFAHTLYDMPTEEYLKHREMDSYYYYSGLLKNFAMAFRLKYLYVYVPDIENDKLIPIFGVDGKTGEAIENFNLGEPPQNIKLNPKVIDMYLNKKEKLTLEMNNEFGHVFTGYSPVFDKNGNPIAIVGADIDFNYIMLKLFTDFFSFFIFIFTVLFILYFAGIFYIQKTLIKPILNLSTEMTRYLQGYNIYKSPQKNILSTDDEFHMMTGLFNSIANEKKRIENELNIAKKIQFSSLPMVFPPYPEHKEFDVFADMTTAKEVGGDFYDFFFIDQDHFAFLIADVCGKGIPAALFMMESKTVLKNIIKTGIPLDEAVTKANHEICKNNKQNYFVTVFVTVININTGEITSVNAGHNFPLIKRENGNFDYYKTKANTVLGVIDNFKYKKSDDKLNKNDMMFLYTDGVTESMNDTEDLYGEERLQNILNKCKDNKLEEIIGNLEKDIKEFAHDVEQSDDITTLVFRYNAPAKN